jgi:hypothetical protein
MNPTFLSAALIVVAGFAAAPSFAGDDMTGEVGYVPLAPVATTSLLTRAMVQHAYVQAQRHDALLDSGEGADIGAVAASKSDVTRAQVRAEARYAVQHGLIVGGEV